MEHAPGTRVYFRGKPLLLRRPLTADERAHMAETIRKGRTAYQWLTVAAGSTWVLVAVTAYFLLRDPLQSLFVATILLLLVVGFGMLAARDRVLGSLRLSRVNPESEILAFGDADRPALHQIVVPPSLALRVGDQPLPLPEPVQIVYVAPPSEMSESVADWMESEKQLTGNRILESGERDELERRLARVKPRFRWLDGVLAVYIGIVLYREFNVEHGVSEISIILVLLSVGWIAMMARLYLKIGQGHQMLQRAIKRNAVRLVLREEPEAPARLVEFLLPDGIPWAADGEPAEWRTL